MVPSSLLYRPCPRNVRVRWARVVDRKPEGQNSDHLNLIIISWLVGLFRVMVISSLSFEINTLIFRKCFVSLIIIMNSDR